MFPFLESLGRGVWSNSMHGAALIGCILLLRWACGRRLPAQGFHLLWVLAAVRLLAPMVPQSEWSIFNFQARGGAARDAEALGSHISITDVALPEPTPTRAEMTEVEGAKGHETMARPVRNWWLMLWMAGVFGQVVLVGRGTWQLRRRLRGAVEVNDERTAMLAMDGAREMGLKAAPRVYESSAVSGPMVVGLWRSRVILPRGLKEQLTDDEYGMVLRHECGHLRRGDLLALCLLTCARVVHWFNPLVWLAVRVARADIELACDEAVLRRQNRAEFYGETLLKLARTVKAGEPVQLAIGILPSGRTLAERIFRIGAYAPRGFVQTWLPVFVTVGSVAAVFGADGKPQREVENARHEKQKEGRLEDWSIAQVTIPRTGKMADAAVTFRAVDGRTMTLSQGRESRERIALQSVEWTGAPVRVKAVILKEGKRATLEGDASLVAHDATAQKHPVQIEFTSRYLMVNDATAAKLRRTEGMTREIRFDAKTKPATFAAVLQTVPEELRGAERPADAISLNKANIERQLFRDPSIMIPRVTTKSGQRAVIEVIREVRYAKTFKKDATGKTTGWMGEEFETRNVGTTLEVEPVLDEDDWIRVQLVPQMVELLGYKEVETGKKVWEPKVDPAESISDRMLHAPEFQMKAGERAMPVFSTRKASASVKLRSGESVMLMGLPETERIQPFAARDEGKTMVVVVTAETIDQNGNVIGARAGALGR